MLTPFALAVHTYRPTYDRTTGEGSVSGLEVVLPEVVRGPTRTTVPAGYEVQATSVGGPEADVAEQLKIYVTEACWSAGMGRLLLGVMVTMMGWARAA